MERSCIFVQTQKRGEERRRGGPSPINYDTIYARWVWVCGFARDLKPRGVHSFKKILSLPLLSLLRPCVVKRCVERSNVREKEWWRREGENPKYIVEVRWENM